LQKYIDNLDHGYSWKREELSQPSNNIKIHSKIVKKAFHKNGKDAVSTLRNYYTALNHFSADGSFSVKELAAVITEKYGYKYNHRQSIIRLDRQLRDAQGFFKQTKEGYYSFTSRRQFLGFQRHTDGFIKIDLSILSKDKNKEFTDLLIGINATGQTLPMQDFCNQTGYSRSRVFDAVKHFQRHNINICIGTYSSEQAAEKARRDLYYKAHNEDSKNKKRIISKLIIENGEYNVYITVGNSFTELSNQGVSCDDRGVLRSSLNTILKLRDTASRERKSKSMKRTTVFQVISDEVYTGINSVGQEVQFMKAVFIDYDKFEKRITAYAA